MKSTIFLTVGLSFFLNSQAQSFDGDDLRGKIGGKWNKEAVEAWAQYHKDDPSEDAMIRLMLHGAKKDKNEFLAYGCDRGVGVFCQNYSLFLQMEKRPPKEIARAYEKACEIVKSASECATAAIYWLGANDLEKAKKIYVDSCNSYDDGTFCDVLLFGGNAKKQVTRMLSSNCDNGHAFSCIILLKHKLLKSTPEKSAEGVKKLLFRKEEVESLAKSWDGKYDSIQCTGTECLKLVEAKASESLGGDYHLGLFKKVPYQAKACMEGVLSKCSEVGIYEIWRRNYRRAHYWFDRACSGRESFYACIWALEAELLSLDLLLASAIFNEQCLGEFGEMCVSHGSSSQSSFFYQEDQTILLKKQYSALANKLCAEKNKFACILKKRLMKK